MITGIGADGGAQPVALDRVVAEVDAGLHPQLPVQTAMLNRLADKFGIDLRTAGQVGDGAGE